jgi:flavorubredoxin
MVIAICLCQSIAKGITKTGVAVETLDLKSANPQEVKELASSAVGIVIGTPPFLVFIPKKLRVI